jgi:hypothetical protein
MKERQRKNTRKESEELDGRKIDIKPRFKGMG